MDTSIHILIAKKAKILRETIVNTRRHLHMYPELPGDERETSCFIANRLHTLGMEVQTQIGGHGVVATLSGAKEGATIAWRADIDACAIQEDNDVPYKSRHSGIMHACGHDAHAAIALGIAETLSSLKDNWCGTVKFIFQPSEETSEGAQKMILDGVLENPRPSAVYGLHQGNLGASRNYMQAGEISLHYGTALFGYDRLNIRAHAKGRPKFHAWAEQEALLYRLNEIRSRVKRIRHFDLKILDKAGNDETGEVNIRAQIRYAKQDHRNEIRTELARIVNEYADESKVNVTVDYVKSIPPVYNDEAQCQEATLILRKLLGDRLIPIFHIVPPHGADDFACFQQELSGLFFFLGSANLAQGVKALNHTSTFNIDEDCLVFGVKTMSSFLFELLREHAKITALTRKP